MRLIAKNRNPRRTNGAKAIMLKDGIKNPIKITRSRPNNEIAASEEYQDFSNDKPRYALAFLTAEGRNSKK